MLEKFKNAAKNNLSEILRKLNAIVDWTSAKDETKGDDYINVNFSPGVNRVSLDIDAVRRRIPKPATFQVFAFTPSASWVPNQGTMTGHIANNPTNILTADLIYGGATGIVYCGLTTTSTAGLIFYGGTATSPVGFLVDWDFLPPSPGSSGVYQVLQINPSNVAEWNDVRARA